MVSTGCLGSTRSSNKHCLSLWQKGSGKGTSGMSGLTSPVGCHIDYNDLYLLFSVFLPSGLLQCQCCSATLHMMQLGREITLVYTNCQKHLFFSLSLAGDKNLPFFKFLCIQYMETYNATVRAKQLCCHNWQNKLYVFTPPAPGSCKNWRFARNRRRKAEVWA